MPKAISRSLGKWLFPLLSLREREKKKGGGVLMWFFCQTGKIWSLLRLDFFFQLLWNVKSKKCKLWIEYWATLTLLLGRYIWTVWFYVFKIDWFLYLSNSETVTVATFEIRLTPLVSMVLPILAKCVACVVHISSITHMRTPSCSQKENII